MGVAALRFLCIILNHQKNNAKGNMIAIDHSNINSYEIYCNSTSHINQLINLMREVPSKTLATISRPICFDWS